jgi:hypothetical protein
LHELHVVFPRNALHTHKPILTPGASSSMLPSPGGSLFRSTPHSYAFLRSAEASAKNHTQPAIARHQRPILQPLVHRLCALCLIFLLFHRRLPIHLLIFSNLPPLILLRKATLLLPSHHLPIRVLRHQEPGLLKWQYRPHALTIQQHQPFDLVLHMHEQTLPHQLAPITMPAQRPRRLQPQNHQQPRQLLTSLGCRRKSRERG